MNFYEYTHSTPNLNPTTAETQADLPQSVHLPEVQVHAYAFDSIGFERLWRTRQAIRCGFWNDGLPGERVEIGPVE
jgi:hypothetical protein